MEIAIAMISIVAMSILWFITYKLLWLVKELAKLVKSDNLQEYTMEEWKPETRIEVWQEEDRYQEVDNISDEALKSINLNPEQIYKGVFWTKPKKETFNW